MAKAKKESQVCIVTVTGEDKVGIIARLAVAMAKAAMSMQPAEGEVDIRNQVKLVLSPSLCQVMNCLQIKKYRYLVPFSL